MKKGTRCVGEVVRVDFPNKGIAVIDGQNITVKNTLPGQKISFIISKARKGNYEGRLVEVLSKSPLETEEPKCVHFGPCGGCAYQTMAYETQLKFKEEQVKSLLDAVCPGYRFEGIKRSPGQWGYRSKMEFSFGDEVINGPLSLGMHKKGSFHDIITVDECKIVDKDYNLILSCVLNHFSHLDIPFYSKMKQAG